MMKGEKNMKCLKIYKGKGYFINKNKEEIELDKITTEDILWMIDQITDPKNLEENFEVDNIEKSEIKNEAHKVIYQNLCKKLSDLIKNRKNFFDEIQSQYTDAIKKYSNKNI